jgi:hypothetical protein
MRRRAGIVVVASWIAFASPLRAAEGPLTNTADVSYVLPSTANVSGLFGAYYKTRLTLLNPNGGALKLDLYLFTPAGLQQSLSYTVPANSSVTFDNALQDLFGYTGGGGLQINTDFSMPNHSDTFVVSAQVYVDGPNGTYTTPIPAMTAGDRIHTPLDTPGESLSLGVQVDAQNRANAACVNAASSGTSVVTATLSDSGGTQVWQTTLSLGPGVWQQVPVPVSVQRGSISWSATGPITYCYAVNVNNTSNDGTLLPPAATTANAQ